MFLLCRFGAERPSEGKGLAIFNQSEEWQRTLVAVNSNVSELTWIGTVE